MRVSELSQLLGAVLEGDPSREVRNVAALDTATPEDVAFAEGERGLARALDSRAGCILVARGLSVPGHTTVAVDNPKLALIRAAAALLPAEKPRSGIHPSAVIAAGARLAADVSIGAHVVIDRSVSIGAGSSLGAGVYIGEGARVGDHCVLYPRVTVYAGARIGNSVVLHAGVVVGSDGFGYVFAEGQYHKFPQLGGVIIEDDVEVGSNTTIDRGSLGTTVIGQGTKIDNLVQIAHNVRIGRHCVIAAQTGISGSAMIGDYVVMAGQVGVGEHARIEDRAVIAGQAGVLNGKVVRKGATMWGTPARPIEEIKKQCVHLANLPALARKVRQLASMATKP
jgi:UDP-3-O-[3-hydroxymyristoyl] glucosamine N-acyltransferase